MEYLIGFGLVAAAMIVIAVGIILKKKQTKHD